MYYLQKDNNDKLKNEEKKMEMDMKTMDLNYFQLKVILFQMMKDYLKLDNIFLQF